MIGNDFQAVLGADEVMEVMVPFYLKLRYASGQKCVLGDVIAAKACKCNEFLALYVMR